MMRLLVIAALAVLVWRLMTGRWPWEAKQSPQEKALADARALLGVGRSADQREILAAHRRVIARVHPDRGGTGAGVHAADRARDLLLARLPNVTIDQPEEPK